MTLPQANDAAGSAPAFLEGAVVRLNPPDLPRDVDRGWTRWFNDPKVTRHLRHGVYPVTPEAQLAYVRQEMARPDVILLTIESQKSNTLLGVISLKDIDLLNGNAEITIVTGETEGGAALEAMALLTKHAFDRLNLIRVYAGQHVGLWKWVNQLAALIGYRLEGYRRAAGRRDGRIYDQVSMACIAQDFYRLEGQRGGKILTNDLAALLSARERENRVEDFWGHIERFHIGPPCPPLPEVS